MEQAIFNEISKGENRTMEQNSGYFLVWRKIWKSPVFKNLNNVQFGFI